MKKEKTEKRYQFKKAKIYVYITFISSFLLIFFHIMKDAVAYGNNVVKVYLFISIAILLFVGIVFPLISTYTTVNKHLENIFKRFCDWVDLLSFFVLLCAICQGFFAFGYFRAVVVGESMLPTFENGNTLIVRSTNSGIKNFDVVITTIDDENRMYASIHEEELLIKRVIGVPGDTLEFKGGYLIINGQEFYEPYIKTHNDYSNRIKLENELGHGVELVDGKYVIMEGYYYLLGDNRGNSSDSRVFGLFKKSQIIGIVYYKLNSLFDWDRVPRGDTYVIE